MAGVPSIEKDGWSTRLEPPHRLAPQAARKEDPCGECDGRGVGAHGGYCPTCQGTGLNIDLRGRHPLRVEHGHVVWSQTREEQRAGESRYLHTPVEERPERIWIDLGTMTVVPMPERELAKGTRIISLPLMGPFTRYPSVAPGTQLREEHVRAVLNRDDERLQTTDAMVWAEEFIRRSNVDFDESTMAAWFANAIEFARSEERKRREEKIDTPCPACHHRTLFIGDGGYITCSFVSCPRPTLVDEIMRGAGQVTRQEDSPQTTEQFLDWLIALDDPSDQFAASRRQQITLTQIIAAARLARLTVEPESQADAPTPAPKDTTLVIRFDPDNPKANRVETQDGALVLGVYAVEVKDEINKVRKARISLSRPRILDAHQEDEYEYGGEEVADA